MVDFHCELVYKQKFSHKQDQNKLYHSYIHVKKRFTKCFHTLRGHSTLNHPWHVTHTQHFFFLFKNNKPPKFQLITPNGFEDGPMV